MRPKFCLAIFFVAICTSGFAGSPDGFELGNNLYAQGKYKEAKQAYETVLAAEDYSSNLFYNLANTEFRLGDPGRAALNYERALTLEPAHPEARANLSYVRMQTGAKITPHSWYDYFGLSMNLYAILAALTFWLALFFLTASLFRVPRNRLLLLALGFGAASTNCLVALNFLQKDSARALVIAKRSDARFAPIENATLVETLPAGSHVRVLNHSGAWVYCDLPNGNRGWLPGDSIEPLHPKS